MNLIKVYARCEPAREAAQFAKLTDTTGWYDVAVYKDEQCKQPFARFSHSKPHPIEQGEVTIDCNRWAVEWVNPVEINADGSPFYGGKTAGKRVTAQRFSLAPWQEVEEFDITSVIHDIPLDAIRLMQDREASTAELAMVAVKAGQIPQLESVFHVEAVESIKRYFGVDDLADINQAMLDAAISQGVEPKYEQPAAQDVEIPEGQMERISGRFAKQGWGGKRGDDAIHLVDVAFDATEAVLALSLEKLHELQDADYSTDDIGRKHVDHEGPCEVYLMDSVLEFFGVNDRENITQAMLDAARIRFQQEPQDAPELSEEHRQLIADDSLLDGEELQDAYSTSRGNHWGEYPLKAAARTEWQQAVANGDTQSGYWDWVSWRLSELMDEHGIEPTDQASVERPS